MVIPAINAGAYISPGEAEELDSIRFSLDRRLKSHMDHEALDDLFGEICQRTEKVIEEKAVWQRDPFSYEAVKWIDHNSILFRYSRRREQATEPETSYDVFPDDVPF